MQNLGGLAAIGDLSSLLNQPSNGSTPMELALELIDEDPEQPRKEDNPGFAKESLEELAATIRDRGVKTPISVREAEHGRYLINHGARRFRASRIAEKATIPAFIDEDYSDTDRVVENIQRDGLTPREVADFIGRKLSEGLKKGEIARSLGKSAAYVTQHITLLNLPDPIAKVFADGRSNDVTLLNELNTAYRTNPREVEEMLADETQELSRGSVKALREFIEESKGAGTNEFAGDSTDGEEPKKKAKKEPKEADPEKLRRPIVQVEHDGRIAHILLDRRPPSTGCAWLKYEDDGQVFEADLGSARLIALLGE